MAVASNTITADQLANYFRVTPGSSAKGDVDTLSIDLGVVRGVSSVDAVFTITNVASAPATATLSLAGPPQIASAAFRSSGTASVTLAPGESTDVSLALSPQVAGHGSGSLRLGLARSTWLYRTYPLQVAAAPQAPATLAATARAAGLVSLSWAASVTTVNLAGYDIYRASHGGTFAKIASAPAAQTSYDDRATVDGTTYEYRVRAVAADDPALDSVDGPTATATADATPPLAAASVTLANGGGQGSAFVNAANRSTISVAVGLRQPASAGDTVNVTASAGGAGVTRATTVDAGATMAIVGGFDLSSLPDGAITLTATIADAAGNTSPASTGQATKDTAAPAAPMAVYVDLEEDDADRIAGLTERNASVTAVQTQPGSSGPYRATASSHGIFVIAVAPASDEAVSYSVTATDAAGNTSASITVSAHDTE